MRITETSSSLSQETCTRQTKSAKVKTPKVVFIFLFMSNLLREPEKTTNTSKFIILGLLIIFSTGPFTRKRREAPNRYSRAEKPTMDSQLSHRVGIRKDLLMQLPKMFSNQLLNISKTSSLMLNTRRHSFRNLNNRIDFT